MKSAKEMFEKLGYNVECEKLYGNQSTHSYYLGKVDVLGELMGEIKVLDYEYFKEDEEDE